MTNLSAIDWYRGDSYPIPITLKSKATGTPIDLSGYSLALTVNKEKDPEDDSNQLFTVDGVIDADPTTGKVTFTPSATHTDFPKGTYWYDIEAKYSGHTKTLIKEKWVQSQDIKKG